MTSPHHKLPDDLKSCHALIVQLQAELHAATTRIETLQSEATDASAHSTHLEALLAQYQETIVDQQQTIDNLAADNAMLKRSLFGCRRERYTDNPAQGLLFGATTPDTPELGAEDEERKKEKKKRTSKGRQRRVFPEFLPREEQRLCLNPEDIPEAMRDNPDARRFFKKVGETLELIPMQLKVVEQFQEVIVLDQPDETTIPDRWIKEHPQHLISQRVYEALDRAQRARERRAERRRVAA